MADQQLSLLAGDQEPDIDCEALLWRPDGHRRCERCRRRLVSWRGKLYCCNVACPGASR